MSVTPRASLLVFADATTAKPLAVRVKANRADVTGDARARAARRLERRAEERVRSQLAKKGDEVELAFRVHPPRAEATASLRLVATVDGQRVSRAIQHVEYAHIPIQTVTPDADVKLVRADIHHKRTRIGYIAGAGDEVPAALRQVGYDVTMLTEETIAHGSLAPYQAIVTGVRAFNVDPRLPFLHERLMKYVADGGTLVVQYNTQNFISSVPAQIGPAPFKISHDRVTDENAAVTHARAEASAGQRAQQARRARLRRLGAGARALLRRRVGHDVHAHLRHARRRRAAAQGRRSSSTKHGKGAFIYTGLAFFRQLPAGVPGAYRLFANLLDYAP